jgi:hypothetical protein
MPKGVYERKPKAKHTRVYKRRAPPSPTTAALIHLERAVMLMPPRVADLRESDLEVIFALKTLQGGIST